MKKTRKYSVVLDEDKWDLKPIDIYIYEGYVNAKIS